MIRVKKEGFNVNPQKSGDIDIETCCENFTKIRPCKCELRASI